MNEKPMSRGMSACAVFAIAVASAVLGAAPPSARLAGQSAPAQAPAAVLRDLPTEAAFRAAFDGAAATPRLVLLLSPT